MSRTDSAVRVISAWPDRVFAALTPTRLPCRYRPTDDRPVGALPCASRRALPTGPGVCGRVGRAGSPPSTPTWSTPWEVGRERRRRRRSPIRFCQDTRCVHMPTSRFERVHATAALRPSGSAGSAAGRLAARSTKGGMSARRRNATGWRSCTTVSPSCQRAGAVSLLEPPWGWQRAAGCS
jgi:hypothetical protein